MDARTKGSNADSDRPLELNEVRLVGTMAVESEEKVMPSGDTMRAFRVAIPRPERAGSRKQVDSLECVAWDGRVKRSVGTWRPGDVVEVSGALRRRFFQTGAGAASRVEVEVTSGRLIRRART